MEGALGNRVLREVEEVSLEKVSENAFCRCRCEVLTLALVSRDVEVQFGLRLQLPQISHEFQICPHRSQSSVIIIVVFVILTAAIWPCLETAMRTLILRE